MKIITGKFCSICKMVKSILDRKGFYYEEFESDSDFGKETIEDLNIKTLPVLITEKDNVYAGKDALNYVNRL